MTPELKLQLRHFIIAALTTIGTQGMVVETLLRDARLRIHSAITLPELEAELREQADKAWLISFTSPSGLQRWRVTSLGQSVAAEMGL